jgi:hypothetical protein
MSLQIPIFKCQWVKHPHGIGVDEYGLTIVDLRNVGHKDEPWVLASTVAQVFYILDLNDEKKHIVVPSKQWVVGVDNVEDEEEYNQFDEVPFFVDTTRINIVETKISYAIWFPTRALMAKENLFMYSSSLHIFYVLLQCNVDIMSLNNYLMYVVETINYLSMCSFNYLK